VAVENTLNMNRKPNRAGADAGLRMVLKNKQHQPGTAQHGRYDPRAV